MTMEGIVRIVIGVPGRRHGVGDLRLPQPDLLDVAHGGVRPTDEVGPAGAMLVLVVGQDLGDDADLALVGQVPVADIAGHLHGLADLVRRDDDVGQPPREPALE